MPRRVPGLGGGGEGAQGAGAEPGSQSWRCDSWLRPGGHHREISGWFLPPPHPRGSQWVRVPCLACSRQENELCLALRVDSDGAGLADGHVGGWVPWGEPRAQNLMSFAEQAATLATGLLITVCDLSAKTSAHSLPPDAPPLPPDPLTGSLGVPNGPIATGLLCQGRAQETGHVHTAGRVGSREGPEVWQSCRRPAPRTGMRRTLSAFYPFSS